MSLKYEPFSEALHIFVKKLFLNVRPLPSEDCSFNVEALTVQYAPCSCMPYSEVQASFVETTAKISKGEKEATANVTANPFLTLRPESVCGLSVCFLGLGGRDEDIPISFWDFPRRGFVCKGACWWYFEQSTLTPVGDTMLWRLPLRGP